MRDWSNYVVYAANRYVNSEKIPSHKEKQLFMHMGGFVWTGSGHITDFGRGKVMYAWRGIWY